MLKITCPQCGHYERKKPDELPYNCEICGENIIAYKTSPTTNDYVGVIEEG
tara:strand:- start:680 stop:832 length:153 start_codon:yes stop_codon:yes gene_type:complete